MNGRKALTFGESLYINEFQLKLYLNDKNYNIKKDLEYIIKFDEYCTDCACYNLLCDLSEEYPDDIEFFWSEDKDTFGFLFKAKSKISKRLQDLKILKDIKENFCEILF